MLEERKITHKPFLIWNLNSDFTPLIVIIILNASKFCVPSAKESLKHIGPCMIRFKICRICLLLMPSSKALLIELFLDKKLHGSAFWRSLV